MVVLSNITYIVKAFQTSHYQKKFVFSSEAKVATPLPEKPQDKGCCSFRDNVLGNSKTPQGKRKTDLIAQKLVCIDYVKGNRLPPKVILDKNVFMELCTPWEDVLAINLLNKTICYNLVRKSSRKCGDQWVGSTSWMSITIIIWSNSTCWWIERRSCPMVCGCCSTTICLLLAGLLSLLLLMPRSTEP